jgi:hypothetical protein
MLMKKYLLTERRPTKKDFDIKDAAMALASEIEVLTVRLLKQWYSKDQFEGMEKDEVAKMINLAVKNVKSKVIISEILP